MSYAHSLFFFCSLVQCTMYNAPIRLYFMHNNMCTGAERYIFTYVSDVVVVIVIVITYLL